MRCGTKKAFTAALREKNFAWKKTNRGVVFYGISLERR